MKVVVKEGRGHGSILEEGKTYRVIHIVYDREEHVDLRNHSPMNKKYKNKAYILDTGPVHIFPYIWDADRFEVV